MADAWGGSWGSSWGLSWTRSVSAVTPITTAGGYRPAATQYRAKTISRELREQEREAKRQARIAAKELQERVRAELRKEAWFNNPELAREAMTFVKAEIAEQYVPRFITDGAGIELTAAAFATLMREAIAFAIEREDEDFLLLANN